VKKRTGQQGAMFSSQTHFVLNPTRTNAVPTIGTAFDGYKIGTTYIENGKECVLDFRHSSRIKAETSNR
jgi:hypothetical protein